MRRRLAALLALLTIAAAAPAAAQTCEVVTRVADDQFRVTVGGAPMTALAEAVYRDLVADRLELEDARAFIADMQALLDEMRTYTAAVDRQNAAADSLMNAHRAQIAEYERLVKLLERMLGAGGLQPTIAAGYSLDGRLTGLAGVGFHGVGVSLMAQNDNATGADFSVLLGYTWRP